jgi:glycosyltransferase involved in cell wall biosynthesis
VERVCVLLAGALERQGWDVSIVGPERTVTRWEFRLGLRYPAMSWSATETIRAKRDVDLIVSNGFLGIGCPREIPRIHLYHGTLAGSAKALSDDMPARERLRRVVGGGLAETLAGRGATRRVCVSETVVEEVRRYYRLRSDATIPNGVDISVFAPRDKDRARDRLGLPRERRYALFVGRIEHGKGSDLVVEAAARGGYELLVAGSTGTAGARHLGILAPEALRGLQPGGARGARMREAVGDHAGGLDEDAPARSARVRRVLHRAEHRGHLRTPARPDRYRRCRLHFGSSRIRAGEQQPRAMVAALAEAD